MEARAHYPRDYSYLGQQDLDRCLNRKGEYSMNGTASNMPRRVLLRGRVPHVAVIGAGFAGLRCADILSQKGLKVTILEGRDRIGGRVHQQYQSGHMFDLGPNWVETDDLIDSVFKLTLLQQIHGTDNNPILELAREMKDTTVSISGTAPSVYDELGQLIDEKIATEHYDIMWCVIGDAFRYSRQNCSSIPPEESLLDFFTTKLLEKELNAYSTRLVLQMAESWGDFVGEPIDKQSLKYFWLEECIEGENLYLASTYGAVLKRVAKSALAKADLQLSTRVTSIVSKPTTPQRTLLTVTTPCDKIQTFDEVIVTCPLGWLKRNISSFSPALPSRIVRSIDNISYGRLEKVYLTFPGAFWLSDGESARATKQIFSNFLAPAYTDQNPQHWTIEFVSLACLPEPYAHATLLFYIHGPCAEHVTSLINGLDPTSREFHDRLDDFFAPYYTRLPGYASSSEQCRPSSIIATNWQNDEFSGWGSYTTFQTSKAEDDVQLDKDIEALREGCPERGLWFAGEHTAPFVALGTTTGAYWSGEAVAGRVAAVYGM